MTRKFTVLAFFILLLMPAFDAAAKKIKEQKAETKVVILGLNDNVKSNYYYDELIAKQTGFTKDSIDHIFNSIMAQNIKEANADEACQFVTANSPTTVTLADGISVSGEADEAKSDISKVSQDEWSKLLEQSDAAYVLVLNQHYLKRQFEPLRTVFYITSYTLYDSNRKEVYSNNQYFSAMDLLAADKMKSQCRKMSAKIASGIVKSVAQL